MLRLSISQHPLFLKYQDSYKIVWLFLIFPNFTVFKLLTFKLDQRFRQYAYFFIDGSFLLRLTA